ncbi:MAG: acyltransferase family protein [Lachnospiraceae bacterium]|nr:acyltransferase family protein [Lachnospiraceae bacterium]
MITPNRRYWDIVKGIGIICVVLGHSCDFFHDFVYQFHLPLFFFVSGFMYSEKKYGDDPWLNLTNKIKTSWLKYVVIYWVILLLHNKFIEWGMMPIEATYFDKQQLANALVLAMFGTANELMGGTLWFVPVLVLSSAILGIIVFISRKLFEGEKSIYKFIFQAICVWIMVPLGWKLHGVLLPCNIQVVLLVVVFQWIGYLIRNYGDGLQKYLSYIVGALAIIFVYIVSKHHCLDLIFGNLYGGMYFVAFCGIYASLVLAKFIDALPKLANVIAYWGNKSFMIMVLHFPIIKIIDKIWAMHIGDPDRLLYLKLPHSFSELAIVYVAAGLIIPIVISVLSDKLKAKIINWQ